MRERMKMKWKAIVLGCCKSTITDHDHDHGHGKSSSSLPAETERQQILKESGSSSSSCLQRLSLAELPGSPLLLSAEDLSNSLIGSQLHVFTFAELREITHNFSPINLLGEGGFGPVHKGFIHDKLRPGSLKPQPVAVKLLDLDGTQGHKEWLAEIIILGQLRHPHLVKLIGYCWEGDHRLLVYEYMVRGSLENQLFGRYSAALPWSTRMKIAVGAAKGLAFLHEADKPIIYRDFKTSNILLDSDYTAKLSDFGLAKGGLEGDDTHISTRIMGTHGYVAPEYIKTGHLTTMSDVYSFGVVLLEVLTGKRSMEKCGGKRERNLVEWARPLLRSDPRKWNSKLERILLDPRLEGQFSRKGAQKAAELAYKCVSQHTKQRPTMTQVVNILEPLQHYFDDALPVVPFVYVVPKEEEEDDDDDALGNSCINPRGGGGWRHRIRFPILQQASYSDGSLYK